MLESWSGTAKALNTSSAQVILLTLLNRLISRLPICEDFRQDKASLIY
jgi:hypothetical protein